MSFRRVARRLDFLCVPLALLLGLQSAAYGQAGCGAGCGQGGGPCQHTHCPPCFVHCMHGPPKIK
jgi:hypothetical protein